jgi:hypothetical protein
MKSGEILTGTIGARHTRYYTPAATPCHWRNGSKARPHPAGSIAPSTRRHC